MTCRQNAVIQPRSSPTPSAPPRGTAQSHGDVTSGLPVPPEPTICPVCLQASAHPPIGARELFLDSTQQTGHADSHPDFSAHLQGRARQLVKLRDSGTTDFMLSLCCTRRGICFPSAQLSEVVLLQPDQGRVTTTCQLPCSYSMSRSCYYSVSELCYYNMSTAVFL